MEDQRRLEGHWVNHRPGYRCRDGHTTAHPVDAEGPRWVYWSQTRIIEQVLAAGDKDLAGPADAGELAAHLRAQDAFIVCSLDTVEIEEPVPDDTEPEMQAADEILADGQLALPMPTAHPRVTPGGFEDLVTDFGPRPGNTRPPSKSIQNVNDLFGG